MQTAREVRTLIKKEILLEWRSRYAVSGVVLYVVSTVFIALLSFVTVNKVSWNALFWVIMLFSAINAVAKSFIQESRGRQLYLSGLAAPVSILLARVIYNAGLMLVLTLLGISVYTFAFGMQADDLALYFLTIVLGSITFSTLFTLVSAIASKAGNGGILMAVLSFPVIIPAMLVLTRLAKNAMDGLDRSVSADEILTLLIINILAVVFSVLLFPYLYRD